MGSLIGVLAVNVRADTSKYKKGMKGARRATGLFVGSLKTAAAGLKSLTLAFAPLAGAAGIASLVTGTESLNRKLNQAGAVAGGLADDEMARLKQAAIEVGKVTKFSGGEAADGLRFLLAAGLDSTAAVEALPVAAKFAQASLMDLGDATDRLVIATSAMGLSSDDAAEQMASMKRVSDVLAKGSTLAATTVADISDALNVAAGSAKIAGMSLEETVSVIIALQKRGDRGVQAGTRIQQMLTNLSASLVTNADAYKAAGIQVTDANDQFLGMASVMNDLKASLAGAGFKGSAEDLKKLGIPKKSIMGFKTLLDAGDEMKGFTAKLEDAGGAMEKMADQQLTPLQSGWANLKAAIEQASAPVLTPLIDKMGEFFTSAGDKLRFFVENWSTLWEIAKVRALMVIDTVRAGAFAAFDTMTHLAMQFAKHWRAIWHDIRAVGIAAVETIGVVGMDVWKFISRGVRALAVDVVATFRRIGKIAGHLGSSIASAIKEGLTLGDPMAAFQREFTIAISKIAMTGKGALDSLGDTIASVGTSAASTFEKALDRQGYKGILAGLPEAVKDRFLESFEALKDPALKKKLAELADQLLGLDQAADVSKIKDAAGAAWDAVAGAAGGIFGGAGGGPGGGPGDLPAAVASALGVVADPGAAGAMAAGSQEFFSALAKRERGPTMGILEKSAQATATNTGKTNELLDDLVSQGDSAQYITGEIY